MKNRDTIPAASRGRLREKRVSTSKADRTVTGSSASNQFQSSFQTGLWVG